MKIALHSLLGLFLLLGFFACGPASKDDSDDNASCCEIDDNASCCDVEDENGSDANATSVEAADDNTTSLPWTPLLDDSKLDGGWTLTDFAGKGEVSFDENGSLVLGMGVELTGVHLPDLGDLPVMDYEIALTAKRAQGGDFFCGLTFPYGESNATLVLGGWGGALVGISSLDDFDASENDTGDVYAFEENRWYDVRLRVTEAKMEAWIGDKKIINCDVEGRKVSMRPGEVEMSAPLGICTYATTGVIRNFRIRKLAPDEIPANPQP